MSSRDEDTNRLALAAEIARLRELIAPAVAGVPATRPVSPVDGATSADRAVPMTSARLSLLAQRFGLSSFERLVLLACAGMELDGSFGAACAAAHGDAGRPFPSFELALAHLPAAHWSAITPAGPLRRWRMITVDDGVELLAGRLRLDERILHALVGAEHLDERLVPYVTPVPPAGWLPPSLAAAAQRAQRAMTESVPAPIIHLEGTDIGDASSVAQAACHGAGLELFRLDAGELPSDIGERHSLALLWNRELRLAPRALLVVSGPGATAAQAQAASAVCAELDGPLLLHGDLTAESDRPRFRVTLQRPDTAEQRLLWLRLLGAEAAAFDGQVDAVAAHFRLSVGTLERAAAAARRGLRDRVSAEEALWQACRESSRPRLEQLAQRILPRAGWDDLILPDDEKSVLRTITMHVRQRATVYHRWGFGERSGRGLGITALFAGVSGTGKTLAAEVLARELRLDLFRVDLSAVVSKYIGETEKNLRLIFDAAEDGGAILLFDEADALFGKRSEVRDSHDRYANIEVSYLLQRMETYTGLAILTTNIKSALDDAFLRRLRFIVNFPFPSIEQRAQIWRRVFSGPLPTAGVDVDKLARLNVTGGHIQNIALNAAFLAADAGQPLRMAHLFEAARQEYLKLERPLTSAETGGWL